jgi:FKBP-type peptidyl-prolyl cis-trans isomerase
MRVKKAMYPLVLVALAGIFSCSDNAAPSPQNQIDSEIITIDNYLTANGISALKENSGIRLVIHTEGNGGLPPKADHIAEVNVTGKLFSNGSVFQPASKVRGVVSSLVDGMQLALTLMPVGTKATVYIPSALGYGETAVGSIPANSILVFEVELLSVTRETLENQRLQNEIQAIDDFLTAQSITAVKDTTGLRYAVTQSGAGPIPSWYSKVRIQYTGSILGTETVFFSGTVEPGPGYDSRVIYYIHGFQVGLQKMPVGSTSTFYVPSVLAFGSEIVGTVPANSNLKYEMELLEIIP